MAEPLEINLGQPIEIKPISKEMPKGRTLIGQPGDSMPIFIAKGVRGSARQFLEKESFKTGSFKEWGGFFAGHYCQDQQGRKWVEATDFIPGFHFRNSSGGALTFTRDTFAQAKNDLNKLVGEKQDPDLGIISYVHSHPQGWGDMMSGGDYDDFINRNYYREPYQFAYVFDPTNDVEACFSQSGKDQSFGFYKRHKGFYIFEPEKEKEVEVKVLEEKAEWQPKVRPFDLVLKHVINEIAERGGELSLEARIMLYAWAGQIRGMTDERTGAVYTVDVTKLINGYGGIPIEFQDRLPGLGYYFNAVKQFVRARIGSGEIDEETLALLTPWEDCPKKTASGQTISDIVRQRGEAGRKVIEANKSQEERAKIELEREKIAILGINAQITTNEIEYPYPDGKGKIGATETYVVIDEVGKISALEIRDKNEDAILISGNIKGGFDIAMADGVSNCAFPKEAAFIACWEGRGTSGLPEKFKAVDQGIQNMNPERLLREIKMSIEGKKNTPPPGKRLDLWQVHLQNYLDTMVEFFKKEKIAFTTLTLGSYNPQKKELEVAMIGNTEITIFRSGGKIETLKDPQEDFLGYGYEFTEGKVVKKTFPIDQGDIVIIYTDGFPQLLSLDQVPEIISQAKQRGQDAGKEIIATAKKKMIGHYAPDDVSVVVFEAR